MKISILMATYNSSKYLEQQLDSLFSQSFKDWTLVIRDDGSTDQTLEIIKNYKLRYPNITLLSDGKNGLGAKESFMTLLRNTKSSYYFFCDHDDVWLPNKVEDSLKLLIATESINPDKPVIVHTDLRVVDMSLRTISESFWKFSGIKPTLLENKNLIQVFNCVTGCTMAFNNNAKLHAFPYPHSIPMHDWWLAISTLRNDGIIKHIDRPTILYRQHGLNEVGARLINISYFINKLRKLSQTTSDQQIIRNFLKDIGGLNSMQYYLYKISYTLIRKM